MKIVNTITGKIGHSLVGPKQYFNEAIKLGEMAICIARDEKHARPSIWLIGGIDLLVDYISLAREKGELDEATATMLLARTDAAKKEKPTSAIERLASMMGGDVDELKEMMRIAQVAITAPIEGVMDYSESTPKWVAKTVGNASIH
jgi:hypothetical protein